ncbi:MAG TPA: hypothetical protein VHY08_19765 [Bacillota bacterium]|nr:hypothetical protein [Bacillota bacterium]
MKRERKKASPSVASRPILCHPPANPGQTRRRLPGNPAPAGGHSPLLKAGTSGLENRHLNILGLSFAQAGAAIPSEAKSRKPTQSRG